MSVSGLTTHCLALSLSLTKSVTLLAMQSLIALLDIPGPNYFEVDMDIASSSTAARILSLVRSLSTSLIVDVGVTIEVRP